MGRTEAAARGAYPLRGGVGELVCEDVSHPAGEVVLELSPVLQSQHPEVLRGGMRVRAGLG